MEIFLFISSLILSSWLIFFSILLYMAIKYDSSFVFIIFNGKQLLGYWLYIVIMVLLSFYFLFIRIQKIGIVINIYELWNIFLEVVKTTSWFYLMMFSVLLLLVLIFMFLFSRYIYFNLRKRLLALYIYYYQYRFFWRTIVGGQIFLHGDFNSYLIKRVFLFTDKKIILKVASVIWPRSFYCWEPRIYTFLIPYLVIFDVITQDGDISKVFLVLPWYYLYMLLRTSWKVSRGFYNETNTNFSEAVYKAAEIDGKIVRWVQLPDPRILKTYK